MHTGNHRRPGNHDQMRSMCPQYITWEHTQYVPTVGSHFFLNAQYLFSFLHCVSKNDTDAPHYNYDIHEGIVITFSRYVTMKIRN